MSTHYARSIPCPGAEFGLPPCEQQLTQHAVKHPDGFMQPGDWIEQEDIEPSCDCDDQLLAPGREEEHRQYWDRVWSLLEAKQWALDDSDPYEGDY